MEAGARGREPAAIDRGVLVVWMLVTAATLFEFFVAGGFAGIYSIGISTVSTWLAVGGVTVTLVWFGLRPDAWRLPYLWPAAAAALGAMVISAALSDWPRFAWAVVIRAAGTAVIYVLLVHLLRHPALRPRIRFTVSVVVAAVAVAMLAQVVLGWVDYYQIVGLRGLPPVRPGWPSVTFGTPNIPAAFMLMPGILVVAWLWSVRGWRSGVVGLLVGAAVIAVSGSRGALIGVGCALVVAVILAVAAHGGRGAWKAWSPRLRSARGPLLVLVGIAVIIGVLVGPPVVIRILVRGSGARLAFWQDTVGMFVAHPIAGTGPGTWAFAHLAYGSPDRPLVAVAHAHDLPLQVAGELGVVGLLAGLVVVAVVLRLLKVAWGRVPRIEVAAVAAGLAGVLGQCLVDNFSDLPSMVLAMLFAMAWLDSGALGPRPFGSAAAPGLPPTRMPAPLDPVRARLVAALGVLVVMAVSTVTLLPWSVAGLTYVGGLADEQAGRTQQALAAYRAASATDPAMPVYEAQLGVLLAKDGQTLAGAQTLARAASLTDDPWMWVDAGVEAQAAGDTALVEEALAGTTVGGAADAGLALNAGRLAEGLGQLDEATALYATAVARVPSLMRSTFWQATNRRVPAATIPKAAASRIEELAQPGDDVQFSLIRLWLAAGETSKALDIANEARTSRAVKLFPGAVTGDGSAFSQLRQLADEHPLDADVVGILARAANLTDAADAYRTGLQAVLLAHDGSAIPLLIAGGGSVDPGVEIVEAAPTWTQLYLVDSLSLEMPPHLAWLTYRQATR
ncbi:MAG TPA: O-antigen ligase family protein [Candidatus Limnocylindrales bacterium]|nr:O-antigen ligase family protein [Candidatus Limnocylindrales bacterium]